MNTHGEARMNDILVTGATGTIVALGEAAQIVLGSQRVFPVAAWENLFDTAAPKEHSHAHAEG